MELLEVKEKPKPLKVDQATDTFTEKTQNHQTSSKVDQGTDPLPEETPEQTVNQEEETFLPEDQDKPSLRVDQATGTEDMGAGASKDGEVVDDDEQYVQRPERKRSNEANQEAGPSSPHRGIQQRPSIKGQEEPVVSVSANGFAVPEITVMEGQTVTFLYEEARPTNNVIQVIHDGDKLRPVIGGFSCDVTKCKGQYNQQFNLEGEYKFAINNVRCTPLTVVVKRRTDLLAEITDDGFNPKKIYIDQGHSIKWQWKQCTAPHAVQEVKYCIEKGCFKKEAENAEVVKTVTGSFRQTFTRPGLYFFQTESGEVEKVHHCAVHVRESQREYKVELLDRSFQPMILLIEEGDRVWWFWDKFKCKKLHSVYQIEAPSDEHGDDEPYEPVQNGFRSSIPSKQGLLSHEFYKPGVYYYSDQNFQEAAEYIGTIIVKPKQKEHYVDLTEKGFTQDVVNAQTGDRIWWTWDAEESLKRNHIFHISEVDKMLNPLAKLPTSENDNGFEPKVITVRPNDRVWWVWQSSKKPHDIIQVSHQGKPIDDGFCSGQARDAPSAFMHQFMAPGVFYFISSVLPKVFGAIVVSTQPQVHEVNVALEIRPDPVTIKCNDIVCWIFRGLRSYDVDEVKNVDQLTTEELESKAVTPRRCISQAVQKTGVIHYYSKSFKRQKKESDNLMDDIRVSSVICDERYDNQVCRLDSEGFHPHFLYVTKGQSVLWTWKGNEEAHNIIHVSSPESKEPLNVISGPKAFNSGKPTPDNSFLYTWSTTRVTSRLSKAIHRERYKVKEARIVFCQIYGCQRRFLNSHIITSRRYFVLPEEIDTQDDTSDSDAESAVSEKRPSPKTKKHWTWWDCVPTVKACFTGPGIMEIFWDSPDENNLSLIKGYQLFLNGVSYCEMFPPNNNSINISGLAGGRLYEVVVEVYSTNPKQSPQMSNKLMMKSPLVSNDGGPIISLERTDKEDAISVVWMSIDSRSYPISGYLVFLNDQQCGSRLVPDPDSNRCKVVIGGCELGVSHKIYVVALPKGEVDDSKVSNLLEVTLPLYTKEIVLPPEGQRLEEEELYLEYIEIHEGSGYLQAMDENINKASRAEVNERNRFQKYVTSPGSQRSASSHRSDDTRMRQIPETIVEVEQRRYKDVRPLRRKGDTSLNESLNQYNKQQSIHTGSVSSETISKTPGMEPQQSSAKPLKSRDSKQDLHQVNRADYISRAMTFGKGVNKFEKSIKNQRMNSLASQEYPYQPEPPQSERTEMSRRQSYASNIASRKSSLHPNDAFHEPYGMERALSPAQMPLSHHMDPMSKRPSVPVINEPRKKPISLRMLGKLGTLKSLDIKMEEHKPFSGITFKMVATAMTSFLTQQNFILSGLAPKIYKHKPKMKFDWAKFRHFVQSTKAFENPVNSATRVFQMKAPAVVAGKQTNNQYMRHFEMADDNDNSEYEENNVIHPPSGPREQFRRHRRMSRSQEDIPHPENRNLSPYPNQRYRQDGNALSRQPRSFDGPSPDRIKRYPIMSGARNIERTRARTPRYDTDARRRKQDYSPSRHERDLSRPRSFTQQDFDRFLHEQGMHNNYAEYEDPNLYYHGNYGRPGHGRDDQPGRDDGYWDEDDESSEDFDPLPPWQQELPHGERYKMLPQGYNTRRTRERHSPGRHGNIVYDSSPDEIERRTDRSRRSSHYRFNDRSPEVGQRKPYRNPEDYYNASPEDDRRGYFGKHSSPETIRRDIVTNRSQDRSRREFLDPKYDADEMQNRRSSSKERSSRLDTERSKSKHKIYDEELSGRDISPKERKKKYKHKKKKPDAPMTLKEYNKFGMIRVTVTIQTK
ncbi:unnamed protein product [Mytilus coruscus]|uniref:Uncharacterized protein n=1 Tax=Mytilus coruscus TaxID=42192 RepID=A0A6J8CMN0_MYTCO|nr:unnamed protein product [Mytilus coruscus]